MNATRLLRSLGVWSLVYVFALMTLLGRYDWSAETLVYSRHAYWSSAYMLAVTLPAAFYLLTFLGWSHRRSAVLTAFLAALCVLPYRWIGAHHLFYNRDRPPYWNSSAMPPLTWGGQWLPKFVRTSPHEFALFALLLTSGIAIAVYCRKRASTRTVLWWLGLYSFLLFETWLHLGVRSPYTYVETNVFPREQNYHYVMYMSPGGLSAVNADYWVFRELEEYFMGWPRGSGLQLNGMLMRRAYESYFTSQFSYFINPYYVHLGLNVALWFLACFCGYHFAKPKWGERTATYFSVFIACGPGFIMYVAQPMAYLPAYALVMILLYLYDRLIDAGQYALFGLLLGISAMVYDLFPFYVVILLYAWYRGASVLRTAGACLLSFMIYIGFVFLQQRVFELRLSESNSAYVTSSFETILTLLWEHQYGVLYRRISEMSGNYLNNLFYAFFIIPVVFALLGLAFNSSAANVKRAIIFAAGTFALNCYFVLGGNWLGAFPRFDYFAYPAIYLLAAGFIEHFGLALQRRWPSLRAEVVAAVLIAPSVLMSNVDVFGHPQSYYWFYLVRGGYFH